MFRNFLKIAIRNLLKNKLYALINIVGLGVALAMCITAYLNLEFAFGFDEFHENKDRIYRINSIKTVDGRDQRWGISPQPLAAALERDVASVEMAVRLSEDRVAVRAGDKVLHERMYFADPEFFEMFTFEFIEGSGAAIADPTRLILTNRTARKYFGDSLALGRQMTVSFPDGSSRDFAVGAVVADPPKNSSLALTILGNYRNEPDLGEDDANAWNRWALITFVMLRPGADAGELSEAMQRYIPVQNEMRPNWKIARFYTIPLPEMALQSRDIIFDFLVAGLHPAAVAAPSIIAFLLLLMACFNFVNTAVSFSDRRLKEIGVRKVVGARRRSLLFQFLGENVLLCMIALALGAGLAEIFVPAYSSLWPDLELHLSYAGNHELWVFFIVLLGATAGLSGIYPAAYISKYNPVATLKGTQRIGGMPRLIRVLLTAQFALSIVCLYCSIIFMQNAAFQQDLDLGYKKDGIVGVRFGSPGEFAALRDAVSQEPVFAHVTGTRHLIGFNWFGRPVKLRETEVDSDIMSVGVDYPELMELQLLEGRTFQAELESEAGRAALVSRKLASELGLRFPEDREVMIDTSRFTVVGIVDDFHMGAFFDPLSPAMLLLNKPERYQYLLARYEGVSRKEALAALERAWRQALPDKPFSGFHQEDALSEAVLVNDSIRRVFLFIAGIALLIALMGLFALVSLNIARRTKEIGIRKILGASSLRLGNLVNREFVTLVVISGLLAAPAAYGAAVSLLGSVYAVHLAPGFMPMLGASVLLLAAAMLTVSSQVYKVVTSNPVDALRYE